MCMEDVRMMRRTATREITTAVGTSAVVIVPQDRHIVSVTLSNNGPNNVTVSILPGIVAGQGILELTTFQPITFNVQDVGMAILGGLFAICAAAQSAQVTAWVTYLMDE